MSYADPNMVQALTEYRRYTIDELRGEIVKATQSLEYGIYSRDYSLELKKMAKQLLKEWYGVLR